jgi:type III restriction enzyme
VALHKNFPDSPHAILDPDIRWFPADEALRETSMEKLMPPLVSQLRKKVKEFRDGGYVAAVDTSKSLLNWWFNTPHMLQQADLSACGHAQAGGLVLGLEKGIQLFHHLQGGYTAP